MSLQGFIDLAFRRDADPDPAARNDADQDAQHSFYTVLASFHLI
jgi:hypothetical protein